MRVLAICGSLQAASSNLTLIRSAVPLAPSDVEVVVWDGLRDVPLFNPDLQHDGDPPPVLAWKQSIDAADAMLIACPEYVHGVPGGLKNALDWLVASTELDKKPIAVTAAVTIAGRGQRALDSLRHTLEVMGARVVGGHGIVAGEAADDSLRTLLTELVTVAGAPVADA